MKGADQNKSDCLVAIFDGRGIEVRSTVMPMYGDAIRALIMERLEAFGSPQCQVQLDDYGALPCVQRARLDTALADYLNRDPPPSAASPVEPDRLRDRRTRLYIPGHSPRFFPNAAMSGADVIVLDLEDAVPEPEKVGARDLVRHVIPTLEWEGAEVAVRINDGAQGLADLKATCLSGVHLFLVPKVESPSQVQALAEELDKLGSPCLLMPLIESALGVERAFEIASSSPRVAAISLGIEDLTLDLGAQRTAEQHETAYARGRLVCAARAAGVQPLASVFPKFDNPAAVADYARQARAMGFEGIGCIHPSQVAPAHRALQPSPEELQWARSVTERFESDASASAVGGAMIDAPVYKRALAVLRRAGGPK